MTKISTLDQGASSRKGKRGELFAVSCPSREVLRHVTSQWGVLVLRALLAGTHRFSDLTRRIEGISEKMLTQTLRALENDGFVRRKSYPVVPPHVEYSLTTLGAAVAEHVDVLAEWIELNLTAILKTRKSKPQSARTRQ